MTKKEEFPEPAEPISGIVSDVIPLSDPQEDYREAMELRDEELAARDHLQAEEEASRAQGDDVELGHKLGAILRIERIRLERRELPSDDSV